MVTRRRVGVSSPVRRPREGPARRGVSPRRIDASARRYGSPTEDTCPRTGGPPGGANLRSEMSAVPALPSLSPSRRLAALARSRALQLALGARRWAPSALLLARRVDLATLASSDIVWAWIAASLLLNLASVAGKAIVWKAALDALPGHRPVRYGHVVPALFIGFLLNTVLFARVGELARVAVLARRQRLAGERIPARRSRDRGRRAARARRGARARGRRARPGAASAAHDLAARDHVRPRARGGVRDAHARDAQRARPARGPARRHLQGRRCSPSRARRRSRSAPA